MAELESNWRGARGMGKADYAYYCGGKPRGVQAGNGRWAGPWASAMAKPAAPTSRRVGGVPRSRRDPCTAHEAPPYNHKEESPNRYEASLEEVKHRMVSSAHHDDDACTSSSSSGTESDGEGRKKQKKRLGVLV